MAVLIPPKPRSVISDDGGRFPIDIPVVRSLFSWLLGGREIIRIENGILSVRKEVGRLGRIKEYALTEICALRVSPPVYQSRRNIIPDGTIAFDYGAKTYRLGSGIDEAEAKPLVETIRLRFSIS